MSLALYDKALLNKIQKWVKDDTIKITSPNETRRLFEYIADINDDKPINLPLIALRRDSSVEILNTNKKPLTFDGKTIVYSTTERGIPFKGNILNAIPISLKYQLDIYTRYFEEADEYSRNFIFNFINYPLLTVEIPYNNSNLTANATIKLNSELTDNSDIPERLVPGQFTRMTLQLYIDDAYLWDYRAKDNVLINCETITELK